jgi:hypothetical protein
MTKVTLNTSVSSSELPKIIPFFSVSTAPGSLGSQGGIAAGRSLLHLAIPSLLPLPAAEPTLCRHFAGPFDPSLYASRSGIR